MPCHHHHIITTSQRKHTVVREAQAKGKGKNRVVRRYHNRLSWSLSHRRLLWTNPLALYTAKPQSPHHRTCEPDPPDSPHSTTHVITYHIPHTKQPILDTHSIHTHSTDARASARKRDRSKSGVGVYLITDTRIAVFHQISSAVRTNHCFHRNTRACHTACHTALHPNASQRINPIN